MSLVILKARSCGITTMDGYVVGVDHAKPDYDKYVIKCACGFQTFNIDVWNEHCGCCDKAK